MQLNTNQTHGATQNQKGLNCMAQIITSTQTDSNNNLSFPNVVRNAAIHANDYLSKILNIQISQGIESYYRSFSQSEIEIIKYLNYYFKKWDGNIQIPIKNLMDRFNFSKRWIQALLSRLIEAGWIITVQRGLGRKVTRRTFTERGKMIIKAITKGFGSVKKAIHKINAPYCAPYSSDQTNYISSKVDILKENVIPSQKREHEIVQNLSESGYESKIETLRRALHKRE